MVVEWLKKKKVLLNFMSLPPKPPIPSAKPRDKFPVFETMLQASAVIGCSIDLIRAVKKSKTCPMAFLKGDRIDTGLLLPALFKIMEAESNLPDGVTSPQNWLALENARIKSIIRQKMDGELISATEAIRQAGEAGGYFMEQLERFCNELPPALAGLSVIEIAKRLEVEKERTRKQLQSKLEKIGADV